MKHLRTAFLSATAVATLSTTAFAEAHATCDIAEGRVSIVGNEFPAIQTIGKGAQACANDAVEIKTNLTADHQKINVAGMTGNPAEYTSAIVANSSIVALMNEDVIRPLDDLVAEYGQDLRPNQLVTVGGKVMAVAFMANAQHLVYRSDILEQIGVDAPTSYEEMLEAAKMIRDQGILENPIGGPYKAGWNLAQEFNNMYIGYGGQFFKDGSAEVSVNNEQGVAALEMMKALSEYMNPDFLTHDSNLTSAEWKAGNVAMMHMWGSRVEPLRETEGSNADVSENTAIAGPLTVGGGSVPATTLWWDGWTVAKNISDTDAEATFKALKAAIDPSILSDEEVSRQAVWLLEGYEPTPAAEGVFAAASADAVPYPMLPYQGLLHTALGAELSDFMQGKETAEQALADVEAAYTAAAKEAGYLQ
ncbi:ABC transporter substrate-binding protein [Litoreibacter roseus]|uniref:Sugar ABC transporter substrate-binding protein n=1 Tax=Litoreibacter roseus TaxID=2601869 RepID=A0A6N6JCF2_9RHOB|nr:extracellular solute-binding protein [Litoreibacter roseus]GFE63657.1 sugar ABC transporter substrate-binding protein [Litoreibacter roseus]